MSERSSSFSPADVAKAFVDARTHATALAEYPGALPDTLEDAYAAQDAAINQWRDDIGGWKVGRIPEPHAGALGVDRLIGPIFKAHITPAASGPAPMPVFGDGFAAVEGEFILELGADAPADKLSWSMDEARGLVTAARAGVEIASSPFPGINDHGPLVTISDFGNNYGLIAGPVLDGLLDAPLSEWRCETFIEGVSVGAASAEGMPNGPVESLRRALEITASRGRPLRKGMLISTGAVTGVHVVQTGQAAHVEFIGGVSIACVFEDAAAHSRAAE